MSLESKKAQAVVLSVFAELGGRATGRTKLQKLTFLISLQQNLLTEFGYKVHFYGPYSENLSEYTRELENSDFLKDNKLLINNGVYHELHLTEKGIEEAKNIATSELTIEEQQTIKKIVMEHGNKTTAEIVRYVYKNYPLWKPAP